jgi:hypothetical protein
MEALEELYQIEEFRELGEHAELEEVRRRGELRERAHLGECAHDGCSKGRLLQTLSPTSNVVVNFEHGPRLQTWAPTSNVDADFERGCRLRTWMPTSDAGADFGRSACFRSDARARIGVCIPTLDLGKNLYKMPGPPAFTANPTPQRAARLLRDPPLSFEPVALISWMRFALRESWMEEGGVMS